MSNTVKTWEEGSGGTFPDRSRNPCGMVKGLVSAVSSEVSGEGSDAKSKRRQRNNIAAEK